MPPTRAQQRVAQANAQAAAGTIGGAVTANGIIRDQNTLVNPPPLSYVPTTPLPNAQAPISAANVTPMASVQFPTGSPTYGTTTSATSAVAGREAEITALEKEQQDIKAEREAAKNSPQAQASTSFLSSLIARPTPEQVATDAWAITGQNATQYFAQERAGIAEIGKLNEDYNAERAKVDKQIADIQNNRGSSQAFMDKTVTEIERAAAPRLNNLSANINTKAAVLKALQGSFAEAQDFVKQAVTDATATTKFNFDMYDTFYKENQDQLDNLDSKYKDAVTNELTLKKEAWKQDETNRTEIGNLFEAAAKSGAPASTLNYLASLISKTDLTPEDIANAYRQTGSFASGLAPKGDSGTSGFKDSKIEADFRADAVALLDNVEIGTTTLDKAYTRLRNLYSPSEVSDEAIKSILGISTVEAPASITEPTGNPKIEAAIASVYQAQPDTRSGFGAPGKMRSALKSKGFTDQEIADSSVGSTVDSVITKISGFLFGKK